LPAVGLFVMRVAVAVTIAGQPSPSLAPGPGRSTRESSDGVESISRRRPTWTKIPKPGEGSAQARAACWCVDALPPEEPRVDRPATWSQQRQSGSHGPYQQAHQ